MSADPLVSPAHAAIELAVRHAYGRLLATLAASWRDIAAAEDALSEALVAALRTWPGQGVPAQPEAWLLAAARRRLIDGARRAQVRQHHAPAVTLITEQWLDATATMATPFPDDRLGLLFVCAHPAIAAETRTPLMLQVVLGLDAARIAAAFALAAPTMSQRLVRAKNKIRDAGIRFGLPDAAEWPSRLPPVLEAVYAAYGTGWDEIGGADSRLRGLATEAVWLGRMLVQLMPDEPEARGLLALMLHCEARRSARRDPAGRYVPLSAQNPAGWSAPLIVEAEQQLLTASRHGRTGRFQLEAAIQSVHAARARTGATDWPALLALYGGLRERAPTLGAELGHAAAVAEVSGPAPALALLDELPENLVADHQPYWALRAHVLTRLGRTPAVAIARHKAIALAQDPAVAAYLAAEGKA